MKTKFFILFALCTLLSCDKGFDVKFFIHNNTNENLIVEIYKNALVEINEIQSSQELIILDFGNLIGSEFHRVSTIDSVQITRNNGQKIQWEKPPNGFFNESIQEKGFYNRFFWKEKLNSKQEHYTFKIDQVDLILFN